MGHHGSSTSSTREFLEAVSPAVAIMSLGEGNSYKHPHKETLDKLKDLNIPYYRTDLHGTVVFVSDGVTFNKK
jgi:competence protein ComEC